jgi:NADH-quinone oxidoreductase subunit F
MKEIQMIQGIGVTLATNQKLGRDFTLESLQQEGYQAVFLGVGTPVGTTLPVPGYMTAGVTDAITFLREYHLYGKAEVGKHVMVVGGGNSAIDAARTALRLGAEQVTIVYRRTRDQMPAHPEEIKAAVAEGIALKILTNPEEILSSDGHVEAVRCLAMSLGEFDRSGRRSPVPSQDTFVLDVDQVIFAIGQKLDCSELLGDFPVDTYKNSQFTINRLTGQTSVPWIFAGGDAVTGPDTVIGAVAGGERAAVGIDEFLTGENHAFWRVDHPVNAAFDPDADPIEDGRLAIPEKPTHERVKTFEEVEQQWTETEAMTQCARCLRCDYGK